jgi:hypothetical protein
MYSLIQNYFYHNSKPCFKKNSVRISAINPIMAILPLSLSL